MSRIFGDERGRFWPEVFIISCWALLFLVTDVLFRDDESVGHRAAQLGLWLSLALYVAVVVREHRSTES
jgi:hypothetical protein